MSLLKEPGAKARLDAEYSNASCPHNAHYAKMETELYLLAVRNTDTRRQKYLLSKSLHLNSNRLIRKKA